MIIFLWRWEESVEQANVYHYQIEKIKIQYLLNIAPVAVCVSHMRYIYSKRMTIWRAHALVQVQVGGQHCFFSDIRLTYMKMAVYLQWTLFTCLLPLWQLKLGVVALDTWVNLCADALMFSNRSISSLAKGEPSLSAVEFDSADLRSSSSIPGSGCDSKLLNPSFMIDKSSGSRTPDHVEIRLLSKYR